MKEKTAVSKKKTASKKSNSAFEKYIKNFSKEDKIVEIHDGEFNMDVHIKAHIDLSARMSLMDNIENIFFPSGEYDPLYGWKLFDFIVFQLYTDVDMKNDLDVFDKFCCNSPSYHQIRMCYPNEVFSLQDDVSSKLEHMLKQRAISDEQRMFYNSFSGVMGSLNGFLDTLDSSLSVAASKVSGIDSFNVQDLLHAMEMLEKKDEKKIVNAVLDFQKEKARVAEREAHRVDSSTPAE